MTFVTTQPFIIVTAVIVRDGKYLLIQENHMPDKGKWNLPGGKLDMGEDPREAVVREVREETGLVFEPTHIVGIHSVRRTDVPGTEAGVHVLRIAFGGKASGNVSLGVGDGTEDVPEITNHQWISLEDLRALDIATIRYHDIVEFIADDAAGVSYPLSLLTHLTQG
ncbi:NUDIX domain-containing protein [Candidatus Saccharibacteria bacterium]|nr:MAG: NUDIX domain-containing protein [Candidatus Saccharibacteria bacterium]